MTDRRKRFRGSAPDPRWTREVPANLNPEDYQKLYEIAQHHDTSRAEAIRIAIRQCWSKIDGES